ncbi:PTS transporter subunit EIIC [Enterocloster citroniae]|uniref:PTS transporter subunit EIIC n=1 Tax=Enterocloster citroniae TaxID=358743 RepID=UPI001D0979DF|nr:PTS transporter subunit EIIC [Enterocloster citroniae]MCB7067235.1 PTS transporter subunit EIIC [Enterocloster citroniae]
MSKEKQAAQEILKHIGGQENILNVEHCATRLRLVLKDASEFDKKEIEAIDGVKGSFFASGQHQIILGTGFVNKVYQQVLEITGMDTGKMMSKAEAAAVNMNAVQKASRLLGDVFFPIIPILVATGLFMGLRSLITNLGVELNPTFLTLSQVLIDTAFSFLPALVTYSVMKRFGASPALGIVIGLMLVAPQLPNANQVASGSVEPIYLSLLGLNIPIIGYQGSVLPALILGAIAAKIEKGLRKIVPDVLDLIVTPFITLLSSLFIGLIVIGPIMHMVEQGLMVLISMLMNIPFGVGGFMVGALQQAVVITGLHHTFKALEIELLANTGANPFNALVCGAIVAQGAAGIAAALKTKNKKQRSLYFTSVVPAFLGITEPLIFGGNLPRLTPFICGCIGGGCAGVFSSIVGLAGTGMSITALPGMLLYLNGQLGTYLIACLIGFITAFVLTYVMYKPVEE